jgi:hypothetical protein
MNDLDAALRRIAYASGVVKFFGFAEPHSTWVYEGGQWSRAWHYHKMFEFTVEGSVEGNIKLTVKRIDLLTFLSSTKSFEFKSWDEFFEKLSRIVEDERIDKLEMARLESGRLVVEPLWYA